MREKKKERNKKVKQVAGTLWSITQNPPTPRPRNIPRKHKERMLGHNRSLEFKIYFYFFIQFNLLLDFAWVREFTVVGW